MTFIIKFVYFSDLQMVGKVFDYPSYCENLKKLNPEMRNECEIYMSVDWLIVIAFASLVIAFTTLFPFFVMKKNN